MAFAQSVRAKLLIVLAAMLALMLGAGALAISGFNRSGGALSSLSDERLPDILAATSLVRQSTALAALAPFVSSLEVMTQLESESERIGGMISALDALVRALPGSAAFTGPGGDQVRELAGSLSDSISELLIASRRALEIRAEIVELHYGFERRSDLLSSLPGAGYAQQRQELAALVEIILTARIANSSYQLDQLELRYQNLSAGLLSAELPPDAGWITRFVNRQSSLFDLRRNELLAQQRIRFLLASVHSLSGDMGDAVAGIVASTSQAAEAQSAQISETLARSGRNIALLGAIALALAVLAAAWVLGNLARHLDAVTRAMTQLAAGDQSASIPGLTRNDELGALARAFRVFKDSSREREALADQVSEGNRLVEAMFANMSDGISVFDRAQQLVTWNPQFIAMTGLDAVERGMDFTEISAALQRSGIVLRSLDGQAEDYAQTALLRASQAAAYELHHPDGRVIEIRSQPMPEGGFVTVYMDQTDRRRIERQLRQSQRMEALGQLTGGISHDFNNFLAAISGNLQMLQDQLHEDPAVSARILRALDATERAASVTQRLLAFARQQMLQPEVTRVEELMFNLLELLGHRLAPNVDIRAEIEPGLPPVLVDPAQLESAVLNLLFNSRDAMPDGGTVVLRVACDEGRHWLSLEVEDSGCGMSPEVLARIYEPFFTTKSHDRGSGLGLSMVYGFITQSGGEITIDSVPGQGTKVLVRLPLARDLPSVAGPRLLPESAPAAGVRVLLAEDDPLVLETTSDMLRSLGYVVETAPDPAAATRALEGGRFDLLFSDMLFPEGQTGLDVARIAARLQPGLPVLFASGYVADEEGRSPELPEGVILLRKPYRKADLVRALTATLQARDH